MTGIDWGSVDCRFHEGETGIDWGRVDKAVPRILHSSCSTQRLMIDNCCVYAMDNRSTYVLAEASSRRIGGISPPYDIYERVDRARVL